MTSIDVWTGEDLPGLSADTLREAYPVPEGGLLILVRNDTGDLVAVQNIMPGVSGRVPITEADLPAVEAAFTAAPGFTEQPPPVDLEALRADVDWLTAYIVTGEA